MTGVDVGDNIIEVASLTPIIDSINRYKSIAVVDTPRTFSQNDCVVINPEKHTITHINVNTKQSLKFDELVSSYDQVHKISHALAYKFVDLKYSNKVVINMTDPYGTNNNCGFNLANFKPSFIQEYFADVVCDYERSFIGSFVSSLFELLADHKLEAYLSIVKFNNNMGFNLTQNVDNQEMQDGMQIINEEPLPDRKEVLNLGAIPEFCRITCVFDVYKLLTEANLKNQMLLTDDQENIKDDICMVQFKLVSPVTGKPVNTFTFVNMNAAKSNDVNYKVLSEVISKFETKTDFIPFNKAILTRILYDSLKAKNVLVIAHYTKQSLTKQLTLNPSIMFTQMQSLGYSIAKSKITAQQALKLLEQYFKEELRPIYYEIDKFREGKKSFEVYTEQLTSSKQSQITMFQQMLSFLTLKDEVLLESAQDPSDDQIQNVIFDSNYIKYIKGKEESAGPISGDAVNAKAQQIQYQCVKSELKDEYVRKLSAVNKRIAKRQDPSFMLLDQLAPTDDCKQQDDKTKHYQFYLENAQKAIDLMIQRHKAAHCKPVEAQKAKVEVFSKKLEQLKPLNQTSELLGQKRRVSVPIPKEYKAEKTEKTPKFQAPKSGKSGRSIRTVIDQNQKLIIEHEIQEEQRKTQQYFGTGTNKIQENLKATGFQSLRSLGALRHQAVVEDKREETMSKWQSSKPPRTRVLLPREQGLAYQSAIKLPVLSGSIEPSVVQKRLQSGVINSKKV